MSYPKITVRSLTTGDWPVITRLFGANGACGGCWCMWWRVPRGGKTWDDAKGAKNRNAFRRLIQSGKVHGVLAFAGDEPVGWCCFGPRTDFPRLETVRALRGAVTPDTWSITCFYIPARWRNHGIATQLLEAATARALELGAPRIEGYPIVPKKTPVPAAFAFAGLPTLFASAGYKQDRRPAELRPVYSRCREPSGTSTAQGASGPARLAGPTTKGT